MYWLVKNLFRTNMDINTSITIMHLALTTSCDGGALLTTQGTHICLILSFILRGGRVALVSPNMRWDMVPWSIRRVTDLPLNAKLCEMQQNTHGVVQLIRAATPDVPHQTPTTQYISPTGTGPYKKRGLGLHIKSGPKRCPARARRTEAPPMVIMIETAVLNMVHTQKGFRKWLHKTGAP